MDFSYVTEVPTYRLGPGWPYRSKKGHKKRQTSAKKITKSKKLLKNNHKLMKNSDNKWQTSEKMLQNYDKMSQISVQKWEKVIN